MLDFFEVHGTDAAVDALLTRHFQLMRATSPAESCHVMTSDELRMAGARVFAGRTSDGEVLAVGAYKPLGDRKAELKSMHCHDKLRGTGVGRLLLAHLMQNIRKDGVTQVLLETGSDDVFLPARKLYHSAGFTECPPFGDYVLDPLSIFMRCDL